MAAIYFSVAVIVARDPQQIAGAARRIIQSGQNQIAVAVIPMQEEAVVPINPHFSG